MSCPFSKLSLNAVEKKKEEEEEPNGSEDGGGGGSGEGDGTATRIEQKDEAQEKRVSRCPLGYDSGTTFKLGPLSCVICRALLFDASKSVPCGHIYCRFCISRFHDCPICGADIEGIEADNELQKKVDQFIEGHARVKRLLPQINGSEEDVSQSNVVYADVSLERGTFLVQQAMRAFQAQNVESARARLLICAADIKEELARNGSTSEIYSQLGAVLGMLGDCSRSMGKNEDALEYYDESVVMLSQLQEKDAEVVHALSVSLNKMGDMNYYGDDLLSARAHYARALDVRWKVLTNETELSSQVLDIAVSLTKVADVDRALGNDSAAMEGFQEAIKLLEKLTMKSKEDESLERRRLSVLGFLQSQVKAGRSADRSCA